WLVPTVVPRLPDALAKGRRPQVRAAAGGDEGHAALVAMLDGDEALVLPGLQALRVVATSDDAGRVTEILRRTSSIPVKREACQLLGKARHRPAVPELIELLAQDHAGLAASAHWALKEITGERLKADPALWREWWSRADRR